MKKEQTYFDKAHRIGKVVTLVSMAIFLSVPLIFCMVNGIMPKMADLVLAAGGICAIFIPMGVAEVIAEVPVMGSSYYLASTTGNILNMKLPASMNAVKIADVKPGTEEADAISCVAVAASSLVTIVMLALGVLLLTPLKPMLSSDVVSTAANYVLPALFGCMVLSTFSRDVGGGVKIYGRNLANIIPLLIVAALYFFIMPEQYESYSGFVAVILIVIIFLSCKYLYKKGKIRVEMPEEIGVEINEHEQ
ncbi:hypothetical protein M2140_002152 [Clostridiales Family XIII bacterium PM5-7]